MALDVIDFSAEGLVAYVVLESRAGRPREGQGKAKGRPRPDLEMQQVAAADCRPFNGI
jgi:hypothetical protein